MRLTVMEDVEDINEEEDEEMKEKIPDVVVQVVTGFDTIGPENKIRSEVTRFYFCWSEEDLNVLEKDILTLFK